MDIKVNDQVQVQTKSSRHQLFGQWLTVKSVQGEKTITALDPVSPTKTWRIPRGLVTKVRANDGKTIVEKVVDRKGTAVPDGMQSQIADLQDRVKELEAAMAKLLLSQNA